MAEWKYNLDLTGPWAEQERGYITIQELETKVLEILKKQPFHKDDQVVDVINNLEELSLNPDSNEDDFDAVMSQLYDWGDQEVRRGREGTMATKMCWISTS